MPLSGAGGSELGTEPDGKGAIGTIRQPAS